MQAKVGVLLSRLRDTLPQIPAFQESSAQALVDNSRLRRYRDVSPPIVFQLDGRTWRVNFFSNQNTDRDYWPTVVDYSAGIEISCYGVNPGADIDRNAPDHRFVLVERGTDSEELPDTHSISYNNPTVSGGSYVSNREPLFDIAESVLAPILNFTNPAQT